MSFLILHSEFTHLNNFELSPHNILQLICSVYATCHIFYREAVFAIAVGMVCAFTFYVAKINYGKFLGGFHTLFKQAA